MSLIVFWEYSTWGIIIQFAILAAILLLANTLRRKIPFFRKSLLPTAVIGGFIALALKYTGIFDGIITTDFLDKVTYHTIALGFIALGLKTAYGANKVKEKGGLAVSGARNGLIIVGGYVIQGIVGLAITYFLAATFMPDLFASAGLLLPMGFGQGPGQANNYGTMYESQFGFVGGQSFGLSIASLGFVWACIPGVIYMNMLRRKGKIPPVKEIPYQDSKDLEEMKGTGSELPLVDACDKMTIQIGFVLLTFGLTFLFMWGFDKLLIDNGTLGNFGVNTVRPLIWGFNFIFGTLFAILVRKIMAWMRKKGVAKRDYISNFMMNRIAGVVFDFMIIASIMAIDISVLKSLWVPLLLVTTAGGFVTLFYLKFIAKRFYKGFEYPGFFVMYGTQTGTASTGIALLREVDPNFETPASQIVVSGSVGAMVFGFPLMLLMSLGPKQPGLTLIILIVFFAVLMVGLNWRYIFKKRKPKVDAEKHE
ncbi:MAG: hypothetical protein WC196_04140 [Bacilli bacterium]